MNTFGINSNSRDARVARMVDFELLGTHTRHSYHFGEGHSRIGVGWYELFEEEERIITQSIVNGTNAPILQGQPPKIWNKKHDVSEQIGYQDEFLAFKNNLSNLINATFPMDPSFLAQKS